MKNLSHFVIISLLLCLLLGSQHLHAQNLLLGPGAGASLAGGLYNTLLGEDAGNNITVQSKNTIVGFEAGLNNQSNDNTFFGYHAGRSNTTGIYNTFLGIYAGKSNIKGRSNTFVGRSAGLFNDGGSYNTFIGELAGSENGGAFENTFVGYKAGSKTNYGGANSFFGHEAGEKNTRGQENTFLGGDAGRENTSGSLNAFGGRSAGQYNTTGSLNVAWGYWAGLRNTTGRSNTFIGTMAGEHNVRGDHNTYLGQRADGWETNNNSTALGNEALVHGNKSTAIGDHAYVHGSHRLVLGATAGYNGSGKGTFVGIGKVTPNYLLHLGKDDAAKPGSNVWTIASDRRLKKDITPFTDGLDVISQIDPVRFRYNGQADMPTNKEFVGIIAQDIQRVAPDMVGEFVHEDTLGNKESFLDYDGNSMTYLLINAVKELKVQNELLKEELQRLRQEISKGSRNTKSLDYPQSQAKLGQNYPNPASGKTTIPYEVPTDAKMVY